MEPQSAGWRRLRCKTAIAILALILARPLGANETAAVCDRAAVAAAQESGIPVDVLRAIALNETGRNIDGALRAWPWAVNMEGEGHWFPSFPEALRFSETRLSQGAVSFDIGCFQINYRWHGQAFASLEAMFDPAENARYAARFLSQLYAETGDWSLAAGAYHSRTPERAARYRTRFEQIRASLSPPLEPERATTPTRLATFVPFLSDSPAGAPQMGSLVPIGNSSSSTRLIFLE